MMANFLAFATNCPTGSDKTTFIVSFTFVGIASFMAICILVGMLILRIHWFCSERRRKRLERRELNEYVLLVSIFFSYS